MSALVSTRFLLPSLAFQRLPFLSGTSLFHRSAVLLGRGDFDHGPLTLASLGFRSEMQNSDEKTHKNKHDISHVKAPIDEVEPTLGFKSELEKNSEDKRHKSKREISPIRPPTDEVKPARSTKSKAVVMKRSLPLETAPFAAQSFSELGLPPLLLQRLEHEGFKVPTDVQSAAIPTILENHDVVIQSYTGSGKTLAYLLPILSVVGPLRRRSPDNSGEPGKKMEIEAVIVAPSRELGMQIVREVEKLLGPSEKKAVQQLVGGANRSRQEEALKKNKPSIVVGTPGRIAEISAAGRLHTHSCRFLVLDEVDELLSFNFREDMHRILEHVGRRSSPGLDARGGLKGTLERWVERQTIMVSATVPFSVIRAAGSWGNNPLLVQAKKIILLEAATPLGSVNVSNPAVRPSESMGSQDQAPAVSLPPSLKHYYCISKLQHKVDALRRCIHALDAQSVIAFMNNTKQLKDAVYKLEARGIKALELHGDLGKLARSTTLKKFKSGEVRVLVTNELSARGLDVAECDLVVNLDLPTDSTHYAHRAGRTGRLGRKGIVVSLCEEPEVFVMKKLQKQLGVVIPACEFVEGKLVVNGEEGQTLEATG